MIAKVETRLCGIETVVKCPDLYELPRVRSRISGHHSKRIMAALGMIVAVQLCLKLSPARRFNLEPRIFEHVPVVIAAAADTHSDTLQRASVFEEGPVAASPNMITRFRQTFRAAGVPEKFVWLGEIESGWNSQARSRAGAVGVFQLTRDTAHRFHLRTYYPDERLDPEKNARVAARYLKALYSRFESWPLVLAAYNCGEERVSQLLWETGGSRLSDIYGRLPGETRSYVVRAQSLIEEADKQASM